jgi:hypothetical protein
MVEGIKRNSPYNFYIDNYNGELWLEDLAPTVPPKGLLGKAINYTLGQWPVSGPV